SLVPWPWHCSWSRSWARRAAFTRGPGPMPSIRPTFMTTPTSRARGIRATAERGAAAPERRASALLAPSVQSPADGIPNPRVVIQPEEAVRPEVAHPPSVQLRLPVRTDRFQRHVLHEQVGVTLEGRLEVLDERILLQGLCNSFDQVGHE